MVGSLAGLELIKQHYDLKRNFQNKYHYILPFIIPSYLMTYKSKKINLRQNMERNTYHVYMLDIRNL